MALPAHAVHIPAGLSIDERTRAELLETGQANLRNENVRQYQLGCMSKRLGYASLGRARTDGTSRASAKRLFAHNGSACTIDGTYADLYVAGQSASRVLGRVPEIVPRFISAPSFFSSTIEDVAYCNGYYAFTSNVANIAGGRTAVVSVLDAATEQPAYANTSLATGTVFQFVAAISNRYFVAVFAATTNIVAYYFDTQNFAGGWVSLGNIATNFSAATSMAIEQLDDRVAVAYGNNGGGTTRVSLKTFDTSGVLQSTTFTTANDVIGPVDVAGRSSDTLWVSWVETSFNPIKVVGVNPVSITSTTATTAAVLSSTVNNARHISIIPTTTGAGRLLVQDQSPSNQLDIRSFNVSGGAVNPLGSTVRVQNIKPASRGFYKNGRCYIQAYSGDGAGEECVQQEIVLVDVTDDNVFVRPVVVHSDYTSTISEWRKTKTVQGASASKYYSALNRKKTASSVSAEICEYDFAPTGGWQSAPFQGATFLAGGLLTYLDGDAVYEAGFLFRPPNPTFSSAAGLLTTTLGGYFYAYVYEHIDATGAITISGVSNISGQTGNAASKQYTVSMAPLSITMRQNGMAATRIGLYRTTDGGAIFYRLATVAFDGTASSVTYVDSTQDVVLQTRAQLYRQLDLGSAQDRRAPGPLRFIKSYNGFLVGAFGRVLYWSGQAVDGEGVWFSPLFQSSPLDADITGIEPLDGALVVYTRKSIYLTAGDPPVDNATQGGLGDLRRVTSDVGCTDARSIVATAQGHFFKSDRGVEVLTRAQAVTWAGDRVLRTLRAFPVISSAIVDDRNALVRFSLAQTESTGGVGGTGRDLVYDLAINAWQSVDDKTGSSAHEASQDAALIDVNGVRRYAWLGTDGTIYYEKLSTDATAHLDGSAWITPLYETVDLKQGLQQDQRVFHGELLFEQHSAAGIKVEFAYNYGAYSSSDDKVWTESATLGKRQLEMRPKPHSFAVRMRISDTPPAVYGTGKGFTFIGISADVAPKQGTTRGTPRLDVITRR